MTIGKVPIWALAGVFAALTVLTPHLPSAFGASPSGVATPEAVSQVAQEEPGLASGVGPADASSASEEQEDVQALVGEASGEPSGVTVEEVTQSSLPSDPKAAGVAQ